MRNKFTRYMAIILDVSLDALTDMSETKIHTLASESEHSSERFFSVSKKTV